MKGIKSIVIIIILVAIAVVVYQSVYIVNEKEQVIITQFGAPIGEAIVEPGIHFKKPFVQKANYFEKRYLEWDGRKEQLPTKDEVFIFVDTYARWEIIDPLQFFKRLRNEKGAQSRLNDILNGETRDVIANHDLKEVVRSSNRTILSNDTTKVSADTLDVIFVGREKLQNMIRESANIEAIELGIKILDVRFKRINYEKQVSEKVYDRMRSNRYEIADKFRSEGQGEASRINGEKERELLTIQSEAYRVAEEIKGKADGEAASIYAAAYDQSTTSRDLYGFLKTLETYKTTFDKNTSIILSTDSDMYRYLNDMK